MLDKERRYKCLYLPMHFPLVIFCKINEGECVVRYEIHLDNDLINELKIIDVNYIVNRQCWMYIVEHPSFPIIDSCTQLEDISYDSLVVKVFKYSNETKVETTWRDLPSLL